MSSSTPTRLILRLAGALPLRILFSLTRGLAHLSRLRDTKAEAITRVNLDICFPGLAAEAREALVRSSLDHDALTLAECAPFYTRPGSHLSALVDTPDQAVLDAALSEGKGVLLCAPHFGAWELLGQVLSQRYPLHVLYKPSKRQAIDDVLIPGRTRFGATLHPTNAAGVRGMHRALAANGLVSILPDQEPDTSGGEFSPFFGEPALTMTLLNRLARKRQVPVLLAAAVRDLTTHRYTFVYRRIDAAIHSADTHTALSAMNQAIESLVREHPAQYIWSYRRFQSMVDGNRRDYRWYGERP